MEAFSKSHDTGAKEKSPLKSITLVQRRNAQDTENAKKARKTMQPKASYHTVKDLNISLFGFMKKKK